MFSLVETEFPLEPEGSDIAIQTIGSVSGRCDFPKKNMDSIEKGTGQARPQRSLKHSSLRAWGGFYSFIFSLVLSSVLRSLVSQSNSQINQKSKNYFH